MKRDFKTKYYKEYFEIHKEKTASIWKGIRSLVKLKSSSSSKKDKVLLMIKGLLFLIKKNCNHFNNYFVNIGHNVDKMIPNSQHSYREYLHQIKVNKSFC